MPNEIGPRDWSPRPKGSRERGGEVIKVIHPVLALHVVREGRMFLRVLEELRGQSPTEEIPE